MDFALARKRLGFTQAQIAEKLGVHQSTVALWEAGATHPNVSVIPKAAEIYGVDASELIVPRKKREKRG
jgi:transcriptional regulator with XRE-family HTH domain